MLWVTADESIPQFDFRSIFALTIILLASVDNVLAK